MEKNAEKYTIIQFYVASVVIFIILAAVGYFLADRWGMIPARTSSAPSSQATGFVTDWAYVDLPRMTVSLGNSAATHMQVDISLEVAPKDVMVLEGYLPQIMDRFNLFLPHVKVDELSRPIGMYSLHKNMLRQVNNMGMPVSVHDLMLQNVVIK
jgi:flagellar basal body-associated protein FliL